MTKLLDMADKYDSIQDEPLSYLLEDYKGQPLPKLYADEGDVIDDEPTLKMVRPIVKRYPGVGLLLTLAVSILFWGALARFVIFR
jgi:hypothetical protein